MKAGEREELALLACCCWGGPEPGRRSKTTQEFLKRLFESQETENTIFRFLA